MIFRFFIRKELKKYPFFFFILTVTLMLGTLGLIGISLVSNQVENKLKENAKELLTSDLVVSARRDLTQAEKSTLQNEVSPYKNQHYRVIDLYSMVTHLGTEQTRLVEIRAVEEGFPFYGKIEVKGKDFGTEDLYISQDLHELFNIGQNELLQIGSLKKSVSGIVTDDSSQGLRGFSLAPRLYLPLKLVMQSGLIKEGATGSYAYHYRFPDLSEEEIKKIQTEVSTKLPDPGIKVSLPEDRSEQTGRVLNYLTDFMSLSALIGLILSLVGIFYLYQSHLLSRLRDFCLLNLHGLYKRHLVFGIILQFSLLFLLVLLLQLLIVIPGYKVFVPQLSSAVGMELSSEINLSAILLQLPFLYALSLTILIPLLMGLMRTSMGVQLKASKLSMGRFRFIDFTPFILLLWAYACYLSHSFKTGSFFFFSLVVVFVLSTGFIKLIQWGISLILKGKGLLVPSLEMGIALRNLTRSGHKLTLSFLSLAMGATLISLILQLDQMIQKEFTLDEKKPSLFIFDIQDEQMDPLKKLTKELGASLSGVTPMVRARLESVNGKAFKREEVSSSLKTREDEVESRFRNRAINLTYRGELSPAERIIEGEPFPSESDPNRPAYISIEKRFAQRLGLKLGDKLTFDIQGVSVDGVVRNFREVKWTSFYPNFFVSVEPGYIEEAPKTYLAVLPSDYKDMKVNFQREVVSNFSNISFINVEELISKLSSLFDRSRQAIELISFLSLGVGLVILYGLSHDQVYRRYYDLALMKSLGLTSKQLRMNLLYEFGTLFTLAMSLGLFLGWFIAVLIGREIFKLDWTIDWERIIYPALGLSVLCLGTILLSSWRAIKVRPKALLSDS